MQMASTRRGKHRQLQSPRIAVAAPQFQLPNREPATGLLLYSLKIEPLVIPPLFSQHALRTRHIAHPWIGFHGRTQGTGGRLKNALGDVVAVAAIVDQDMDVA